MRVSRALRFHLVTLSGYPLSVHTLLQHISTALGLALVAYWIWRWYDASAERRDPSAGSAHAHHTRDRDPRRAWPLAATLWVESKALRPMHGYTLRELQFLLRRAVPLAISSLAASLLLFASVWQLAARIARR